MDNTSQTNSYRSFLPSHAPSQISHSTITNRSRRNRKPFISSTKLKDLLLWNSLALSLYYSIYVECNPIASLKEIESLLDTLLVKPNPKSLFALFTLWTQNTIYSQRNLIWKNVLVNFDNFRKLLIQKKFEILDLKASLSAVRMCWDTLWQKKAPGSEFKLIKQFIHQLTTDQTELITMLHIPDCSLDILSYNNTCKTLLTTFGASKYSHSVYSGLVSLNLLIDSCLRDPKVLFEVQKVYSLKRSPISSWTRAVLKSRYYCDTPGQGGIKLCLWLGHESIVARYSYLTSTNSEVSIERMVHSLFVEYKRTKMHRTRSFEREYDKIKQSVFEQINLTVKYHHKQVLKFSQPQLSVETGISQANGVGDLKSVRSYFSAKSVAIDKAELFNDARSEASGFSTAFNENTPLRSEINTERSQSQHDPTKSDPTVSLEQQEIIRRVIREKFQPRAEEPASTFSGVKIANLGGSYFDLTGVDINNASFDSVEATEAVIGVQEKSDLRFSNASQQLSEDTEFVFGQLVFVNIEGDLWSQSQLSLVKINGDYIVAASDIMWNLGTCAVRPQLVGSRDKNPQIGNRFCIIKGHDRLKVGCKSEEDRREWVRCIGFGIGQTRTKALLEEVNGFSKSTPSSSGEEPVSLQNNAVSTSTTTFSRSYNSPQPRKVASDKLFLAADELRKALAETELR
eukprot:augustus_masked-scaffold_4-processed-gene-4.8-mRNA-1 protein AED:1.00 eAED:1.00 QI:0/-1/0/0/-1/1/1/0/682